MKTKNTFFIILGLLLTSALLNACGSGSAPTAVPEPASATSPAATATVSSTDTPLPTATDTPAPTNTPVGPFPIGTYKPVQKSLAEELKFLKDGTYRETTGAITTQGTFVVDGNKIVLTETKYTGLCGGITQTYNWSFAGNQLTLKADDVNCPKLATLVAAPLGVPPSYEGQYTQQP